MTGWSAPFVGTMREGRHLTHPSVWAGRFGLAHTRNSSKYFAGGSGALSGLQKAVKAYLSLCDDQQSFMMHVRFARFDVFA